MKFAATARQAALVAVLAWVPRLAFAWAACAGNLTTPDTPAYEDLARAVRTGVAYSSPLAGGPGGFPADLQRPPGYPVFLALVSGLGHDRSRVAWVQAALTGALAAAIVVFGTPVVGGRAAVVAGCLFATDWVSIVHAPLVMADALYSLLMALAVLAALAACGQRRWLALGPAGILFGLAALTKPAAQLVVLAVAGVALLERGIGLRKVAVLGLAYLVVVGPWMARNRSVHGVADLSAIGTSALYFYTALGAEEGVGGDPGQMNAAVNRADAAWQSLAIPAGARRARMQSEAWRSIARAWPRVVLQSALGLARTALGTAPETVRRILEKPEWGAWLALVPLVQVGLLWALALLGLWSGLVSRDLRVLLLGAAVVAILLPAASPLGYSRYRVPAVPLLALLGGVGLSRLEGRPAAKRPGRAESVA